MYILNKGKRIWRKQSARPLRNPHFWIIFCITLIISFSYYLNIIYIKDNLEWLWQYRVFEYKNEINGILLFIPLIYAAVIFGWVGISIVWLCALFIILPQIAYFAFDIGSLLYNVMILTIPVLIVLLIVILSKWMKRETKIFAERELEREAYTSQILKAHEDERKSIARELHDGSIQALRAIANRLQSLTNSNLENLPAHFKEQLELSRDTIFQVSEDLRRLSVNLRPSMLDDLGLIEALRSLVDKFNDDSIKATLKVEGEKRQLTSDADVIIFRFIQEALNNIKRHSESTEAIVELYFDKQKVEIRVHDNGKGFDLPSSLSKLTEKNQFGIIGMQERARMLGGDFKISSRPNEGTSISLQFKT